MNTPRKAQRFIDKYYRRKRFTLFEVDQSVNKIRAEVDPEAELILVQSKMRI